MTNFSNSKENQPLANPAPVSQREITSVCMYCEKVLGPGKTWCLKAEANLDPAGINLSHTACPTCFTTAVRLLEEELRGASTLPATACSLVFKHSFIRLKGAKDWRTLLHGVRFLSQ